MLNRGRRQARLLERYWSALRRDHTAAPPPGLAPELAETVTLLDRTAGSEGPAPAFTETLRDRIETEARIAQSRTPTAARTSPTPRGERKSFTERVWWLAGAGKIAAATLTLAACVVISTVLLNTGGNDDMGRALTATPAAASAGSDPTTQAASGSTATMPIHVHSASSPTATSEPAATPPDDQSTAATGGQPTAAPTGASSGEHLRVYPLPQEASSAIALGAGTLWIASDSAGVVWRIDPVTGAINAAIAVRSDPPRPPPGPLTLAVLDDAVWVALPEERSVKRIDPATNAIAETIALPAPTAASAGTDAMLLALDADSLWIASVADGQVWRIDLAIATITATFAAPAPVSVLAADGSLWVAHGPEPVISRIDPATNTVAATIPLPGATESSSIDGLAATDGSVWVGVRTPGRDSATPTTGSVVFTLAQIDTATNSVAVTFTWPSAIAPFALASHGTTLWIVRSEELGRLDTTTESIVTIDIPALTHAPECATRCIGVVVDEQTVWVLSYGTREVLRIVPSILD